MQAVRSGGINPASIQGFNPSTGVWVVVADRV